MAGQKLLIVNADDLGRSAGVNRGIVAAHEHGVVTSASLMVRWPAAREAAEYARAHPRLSVGLHFDLGEWACQDGEWVRLYRVAPEDDAGAVEGQAAAQLEAFQALMGRDPTHVDAHQHVHQEEPVRSILEGVARRLGVPLRGCGGAVRYVGDFYGQSEEAWPLPELVGVEAFIDVLAGIEAGWTELGCHPGLDADLESMYLREREIEVRTLCDPRVRTAIAAMGIDLRSYHDLGGKTW